MKIEPVLRRPMAQRGRQSRQGPEVGRAGSKGFNLLAAGLLRVMALELSLRPSLRRWLRTTDGWLDFSVGVGTEDGTVAQTIQIHEGRASVRSGIEGTDTALIFRDGSALLEMLRLPPNESLTLLMKSRMHVTGSMTWISGFNFLISLLQRKRNTKVLAAERERFKSEAASIAESYAGSGTQVGDADRSGARGPVPALLTGERSDRVEVLSDPYLSGYTLDDFPRLGGFLDAHFETRPQLCAERPTLLTQWFRENGFETRPDVTPCNPVLRQGAAFKHLMANRAPKVREGDLLAGSTTTKDIGVVIYPDAHGTLIWGELLTVADRPLNPYDADEQTVAALHDVFGYWAHRSFREWVRDTYSEPLCQQLDERFAVYFLWKTVALSHTIPDFPHLLTKGVRAMIDEVNSELAS